MYNVIFVIRKKQWNIGNVLKTGFSTNPFLVVGHTSDEFKQAIKDELVRENFDLIHVETFYVYQNLPKTKIPVVLVEHNIEYLVYERFAKLTNRLIKPLLYVDILITVPVSGRFPLIMIFPILKSFPVSAPDKDGNGSL